MPPSSGFSSPRNTLSTSTGVVVAVDKTSAQPLMPTHQQASPSATQSSIPFYEEAKLVYGVVKYDQEVKWEVRHLFPSPSNCDVLTATVGSRDEQFVNYRTSSYKLHLCETLSGYKFIMQARTCCGSCYARSMLALLSSTSFAILSSAWTRGRAVWIMNTFEQVSLDSSEGCPSLRSA